MTYLCSSEAVGFDHVPLSLNLNMKECDQEMWVARAPALMNILQYHEMDQMTRQKLEEAAAGNYDSLWTGRQAEFDDA